MSVKVEAGARIAILAGALAPELLAHLQELGAEVLPAEAPIGEDLVIDFAQPIGTVTCITIQEPTALQMGEWDALEGEAARRKAVSVCAAVPLAVVEQMKARDYLRAVRRVEAFLA